MISDQHGNMYAEVEYLDKVYMMRVAKVVIEDRSPLCLIDIVFKDPVEWIVDTSALYKYVVNIELYMNYWDKSYTLSPLRRFCAKRFEVRNLVYVDNMYHMELIGLRRNIIY